MEVGLSLRGYLPAGIRDLARFGAPMPCLLAPSPTCVAPSRRHATRARCGDQAADGPPPAEVAPADVAMLLFVPCRTAMGGKFPLNGTYFQSNEVFLVSSTLADPVMVRIYVSWTGAASHFSNVARAALHPLVCAPDP